MTIQVRDRINLVQIDFKDQKHETGSYMVNSIKIFWPLKVDWLTVLVQIHIQIEPEMSYVTEFPHFFLRKIDFL